METVRVKSEEEADTSTTVKIWKDHGHYERKSPKQDLTSAKDLIIVPRGTRVLYHRLE